MVHKKIRIPKESAIDVMEELGKLDDCIQFVDLNVRDFEERKNFGNLIERCDEALKNIQMFENMTQLYEQNINKYQDYESFKNDLENDMRNMDKNIGSTYFDLIENETSENNRKLKELVESYNTINDQLNNLIEKKSVYDKSSELMLSQLNTYKIPKKPNPFSGLDSPNSVEQMLKLEESKKTSSLLDDYEVSELNFISGIIKAEDDMRMKRMIFRASRGRAIPTFFDLTMEDKLSQTKVEKKIFNIFIQGGTQNVLANKIIQICDIFGASRFTIPKREDLASAINNVQQEIYDKKNYLKTVETSIKDFFKDKIGENNIPGRYDMYKLYFLQEKLLFSNLNKCKLRGNFIDGEVWIPEEKYELVENSLLKITSKDPNKLTAVLSDFEEGDNSKPPTYLKLNDFTYPFQTIVSEYGVPRYREVNPGLFTIITFPFMFGVMFGDIGHGGLILLLAIWLVLKKDEILKTMPDLKTLVKTRYFFLLCGFFAFFNGWIYNDFFALPLGIFGSCYKNEIDEKGNKIAKRKGDCVYPIGMDPKWYVANNELSFFNSFKMKMSVIIGVLQMILGLFLKGFNGIYFGDYLDFLFEFIPQLIFMCLLFGYMILMIYIKWGTDWSDDLSKAPSLITQLLMLFLNMGSTGPDEFKTPLFHREDYHFQETFQYYALVISVLCVPVMLLVKPTIEYFKLPKEENNININENDGNENKMNQVTITDLAVNQIIETIEYVLGTVSHTASYLRLWALSLAHAQLAKVFFDITLLGFIQSGSIFGMIGGFFLLANITLGVLMGMDLLECSLHTLRLHWVEFQSKFYKADGYPFTPYSFKYINEEFL
jgi:V-type H+-transporting ATPase subunit a